MKGGKVEKGMLLFTLLGVAAFGVNVLRSDVAGSFQLEDIEGKRAALEQFPLEGYGGNEEDSFRFSLTEGTLSAKKHGYSAERLGKVLEAEARGTTSPMKYFYEPEPGADVRANTLIIAAEGANTVQEDSLDESLEAVRNKEYAMGETIRTDRVDVFCEAELQRSSQRIGIGTWSVELDWARFDTGLSLADREYFFTTGAGEEGYYNYDDFYDNYIYSPKGTFLNLNKNRLKTYSARIGTDAFVVVAPDERCEGQTYVYKVKAVPDACLFAAKDNFWDTVHFRDRIGEAIPLIPVPDQKEARILGLEAISEKKLLLLSRLEGTTIITEVYDTDGRLLGGGKTEGNSGAYEKLQADIIPWEDGTSVDIRVTMTDGSSPKESRLLLWIGANGVVEQVQREAEREYAMVRGDKILYLDSAEPEEEMPILRVCGKEMPGVDTVEVCDRSSGRCLYRGNFKFM